MLIVCALGYVYVYDMQSRQYYGMLGPYSQYMLLLDHTYAHDWDGMINQTPVALYNYEVQSHNQSGRSPKLVTLFLLQTLVIFMITSSAWHNPSEIKLYMNEL